MEVRGGTLLGTFFIGLLLGVAGGYLVWGIRAAGLADELTKTKAWLMQEIKYSDARLEEASQVGNPETQAEIKRLGAALTKSEAELKRLRAAAREAAEDWRIERDRRRQTEVRLAAVQRECAEISSKRR